MAAYHNYNSVLLPYISAHQPTKYLYIYNSLLPVPCQNKINSLNINYIHLKILR